MKRLGSVAALLLVSLTGAVVAYSVWLLFNHLTLGVHWNADGSLFWQSQAPQGASIPPGATIVSVNGAPPSASDLAFTGRSLGEPITLTITQGDQREDRVLPLTTPNLEEVSILGLGFPAALTFWLVGSLLLLQSHTLGARRLVALLAGVFLLITGMEFAVGNLYVFGPPWYSLIYTSGVWLLGALATILHLRFPREYRWGRGPLTTALLLGVAFIGTLFDGLSTNGTNPILPILPFLWVAVHLLISLGLLLWGWWRSPTLDERRQMGVVAVGGLLALGPFLGLIVLPALLGLPSVPGASLALLPVALLPISYGYAILRFRKMAQDRWMARLIVYAFTTVIVVIVFFLLLALPWFQRLPPENMVWVAAILGGVVAGPLMRNIDTWLSWLLFGRWTQPLQVASNAMRSIDLRVERKDLSGQVRDIISRQLQIHNSAVLLLDAQNRLYDPEDSGLARPVEGMRLWPGSVLRRGLDDNVWVRELDDIRTALQASDDQSALLEIPWARAILPLRFDNKLTGLILIGYRSGASFYDLDELIVLELLAISAAAAFHRRKLFVDLEQERDQASMLSQQVLGVRTEERKRVARELHDDIIQPLIAHSYGLAVIDAPSAPTLRTNTLDLVEKIRLICAELREPTLDTLGLGAAVRAAVAAFQTRTQSKAELIVDQHPNASVPDAVASAALGVLQEALANADKHAQAHTIQVRVAIQPDVVRLNVRDDGKGFDVAEARRRAAKTNHFGLLGADERVASVGGIINVQSLPGQGTSIDVYLPLNEQQEGLSS